MCGKSESIFVQVEAAALQLYFGVMLDEVLIRSKFLIKIRVKLK